MYKRLLWLSVISMVLIPFQNCSSGFEASRQMNMTDLGSNGVIDPNAGSGDRFQAAKAVLNQQCMGCHFPNSPQGGMHYDTEREFVEAGLVTAGSLERSKLIYRLRNYHTDIGPRNMPPGGPLTQPQYDALTRWVLNMPGAVTPQTNFFTCNTAEAPDRMEAKRLSKAQLYNTLHGLLARPLSAATATSILSSNANFFTNRVPNDTQAPYSKSDPNFEYAHAKAYFDIADELATTLTNATYFTTFVNTYINYDRGTCTAATPANLSTVCRDVLIRNFLLRAWGRPVEDNNNNSNNELAAFQNEFTLAGSSTAGVNNMIFRALTSPEFLFQVYNDVTVQSGNIHRLSSYAIARRLSFNYMQSGLDEGLLTIARNQDLNTDVGLQAAMTYVSTRMNSTIREFTNEWLKLYNTPQFINTTHAKFQMIGQGINVNANLRSAMIEEMQELMTYLNSAQRPVGEILTSNISFARNADLMAVYKQTTPAPANVTEANAVRFPATERAGLITRAAYLVGGSYNERPVMRGVHVRDHILCLDNGGASPPGATSTPLPVDDNMTLRQKFNTTTSQAACIGCHSQINPPGFALSRYNSLGGYQETEPVFNSAGQFVRNLPVDSSVNAQTFLGNGRNVRDGVEMSAEIVNTQDFKRCMSQHYFSYFHGLGARSKSQASCTMQRMYQTIEGGGTLGDFMRSIALDPRFKLREVVK